MLKLVRQQAITNAVCLTDSMSTLKSKKVCFTQTGKTPSVRETSSVSTGPFVLDMLGVMEMNRVTLAVEATTESNLKLDPYPRALSPSQ